MRNVLWVPNLIHEPGNYVHNVIFMLQGLGSNLNVLYWRHDILIIVVIISLYQVLFLSISLKHGTV